MAGPGVRFAGVAVRSVAGCAPAGVSGTLGNRLIASGQACPGMPGCRPAAGTAGGRLPGCGCAWSGGGKLPAPEVQELGDVVHGAQQLDLGVDGVAAAVADVAAEPGEQLGEGGLDEGGAAFVETLAGRGGQPGGHFLPAGREGAAGVALAAGLAGLAVDRDEQQQVLQGLEVRGGGVAVVSQPGPDLLADPGQLAVGRGGGDPGDQGAGIGGVVVQLDGEQDLPPGGSQLQVPALGV